MRCIPQTVDKVHDICRGLCLQSEEEYFSSFFYFSSHCFGSGALVKKNHGSGDKAGQHRKRDYHGERKGWRTEPPQKV